MEKAHDDESGHDGTISRRRFIHGVIATSATAGLAGLAAGTASASTAATPTSVLNPEQGRVLTRILNQLIPAEGVMPGAGELGVVAYIDKALAAAPHLRRHILGVLGALPDSDVFDQLSEVELERLLRRIEQEQSESFDILVQAAYGGYYSHPQVNAALGWVDIEQPPADWEPFDVALLDPVRKRGPVYRDV
jgi:hypothetical protein